MRYLSALTPALLAASVLLAPISQAAPIVDSLRTTPVTQLPELPSAPGLEKLAGNEFSNTKLVLPDVSVERGPTKNPNKPRLQVPEPNGLILLSLGVFGMGLLRLRTKGQTL